MGVEDEGGKDRGEGFTLAQVEGNPEAFFVDAHTEEHPAGAVRGQLAQVPLDGIDAGSGDGADQDAALPVDEPFRVVSEYSATALREVGPPADRHDRRTLSP